jgi:hypothetical protein
MRAAIALLACCGLAFADDAPAWLSQAGAASVPKYGPKTNAVALLREARVVVDESGKVTTTTRYAVRVLKREGRSEAVGRQVYTTSGGKVKDFRAWLIRPSGEVKKYGKDQVLDVALADNDVYNEARVRAVSARDDAEPDSVFGYEGVLEEKSVFTQDEWSFQSTLPAIVSSYSVTVPPGWRVEGITYNHAPLQPAVSGTSYTWEIKGLPPIEDEPATPGASALIPRLAVSFLPPAGVTAGIGKTFGGGWADVARWLGELANPQMTTSTDLLEKAQSLASKAAADEDKVEAIGRFVQGIRYVAVQTGLGRGGGYKPHAAADVLAKGYGDCKDKANLMRTMLRAVGVESYPVLIYSGDRRRVREDWASPQQFNHCILAAKVKGETSARATVKDPKLGNLLIFDPTDDFTPPGELPEDQEDSLALLVAPESTALLRMPSSPPEGNRLERQVEAVIGPGGELNAKVVDTAFGQSAVNMRRERRIYSEPDYRKSIERWVSDDAPGAAISKMEVSEDAESGSFSLALDFTSARYGQMMQNRLLMFRPSMLDRRDLLVFTEAERQHPIDLPSEAFAETARIAIPQGFTVDEIPDPFSREVSFGAYSGSCQVRLNELLCTRKLVVKRSTLPPSEYAAVKQFFGQIAGYENNPVVLIRK